MRPRYVPILILYNCSFDLVIGNVNTLGRNGNLLSGIVAVHHTGNGRFLSISAMFLFMWIVYMTLWWHFFGFFWFFLAFGKILHFLWNHCNKKSVGDKVCCFVILFRRKMVFASYLNLWYIWEVRAPTKINVLIGLNTVNIYC